MSRKERTDMQDWEAQINALLDGELDASQADQLKAAADRDQALARAIVEAYQLQRSLAAMPVQRAPASLRRRLRRIPRDQRALERPAWFQPRWAAALAALPLAAIIAYSTMGPRQPTEDEIMQARHDLALAFTYLEKARLAANRQVRSTLDRGLAEPVTATTLRTLNEKLDLRKERET